MADTPDLSTEAKALLALDHDHGGMLVEEDLQPIRKAAARAERAAIILILREKQRLYEGLDAADPYDHSYWMASGIEEVADAIEEMP